MRSSAASSTATRKVFATPQSPAGDWAAALRRAFGSDAPDPALDHLIRALDRAPAAVRPMRRDHG